MAFQAPPKPFEPPSRVERIRLHVDSAASETEQATPNLPPKKRRVYGSMYRKLICNGRFSLVKSKKSLDIKHLCLMCSKRFVQKQCEYCKRCMLICQSLYEKGPHRTNQYLEPWLTDLESIEQSERVDNTIYKKDWRHKGMDFIRVRFKKRLMNYQLMCNAQGCQIGLNNKTMTFFCSKHSDNEDSMPLHIPTRLVNSVKYVINRKRILVVSSSKSNGLITRTKSNETFICYTDLLACVDQIMQKDLKLLKETLQTDDCGTLSQHILWVRHGLESATEYISKSKIPSAAFKGINLVQFKDKCDTDSEFMIHAEP